MQVEQHLCPGETLTPHTTFTCGRFFPETSQSELLIASLKDFVLITGDVSVTTLLASINLLEEAETLSSHRVHDVSSGSPSL